ncbi:MAG TPA: hypothetical protein VGM29_17790 [Polyangiaceae bacterium]
MLNLCDPLQAIVSGAQMRRRISAISAVLALTASARANPLISPAAPASENPACARETTALGGLACALASALDDRARGALVVAVSAPGPARLPEALRQSAADLVAARLGAGATGVRGELSLRDAQQRARRRRLVYVTLTLQRDHLTAAADVYEARGRFWERVKDPSAQVVARAFESRPLDPELRALFPPIPLIVTRIDKAKFADRDTVALACGDLDGDGSSELVLVTRRRIASGRLVHGQFTPLAQVAWSELSPVAPSPPREPIAAAWFAAPGQLRVGLSDRADGLELSSGLAVARRFHDLFPWPGGGCSARGELALKGQRSACTGEAPLGNVDFASDVDALGGGRSFLRGGSEGAPCAARPVGNSTAKVLYQARLIDAPDTGAKLVIDDLDGDGKPELVSSAPSLERKDDALVVRTLDESGALRLRWRLPVPSGIDAIAVCPGDGNAMAPLALATGDGVWLVR